MLTNSKLTWWNSKWIAAQDLGTRFSPRRLSLRLKACRISFHRWSPQAFVVGILNWIHLSSFHHTHWSPELVQFHRSSSTCLVIESWFESFDYVSCNLHQLLHVLDRVSVKLLCAQLTSPNSINQVHVIIFILYVLLCFSCDFWNLYALKPMAHLSSAFVR